MQVPGLPLPLFVLGVAALGAVSRKELPRARRAKRS
jgi:hypothetical protein